LFYLN